MRHFHTPADYATEAEYDAAHIDIFTPEHYGAKGDGVTDDAAAFQAAINAVGVVYPYPKTYFVSTLPTINSSGQGIVGYGQGLTNFILAGAGIRRDAAAGQLENCRFERFSVLPADAALFTVDQQSYVDAAAIDLTGMSRSIVRDVASRQIRTGLKLDYLDAAHRTYYNEIQNFRVWGGETGIFVGGAASPRDGANANKFFGCELVATAKGVVLRGGLNCFVGTRIENPLQTAGYPAAAVGIQADSGHYAINNTFTDTYCELVGTGNKGIYFHYSGLSGAWCSPNRWQGGSFSVNGGKETPTFDAELAAQVYGQHFDVPGLAPTRRLGYSPDGTLIQETYPNGGGVLQTDAAGSTVYSAT